MSSRIKGIPISVSSKIRDGQNDVHVSPINIVPETEFGASCIDESRVILVQTRTKAEVELGLNKILGLGLRPFREMRNCRMCASTSKWDRTEQETAAVVLD